jgi:flagellar biogenesis protein FliO
VPQSSPVLALAHHATAGSPAGHGSGHAVRAAAGHTVRGAGHAVAHGATGAQSVSASSLLVQMVVGLVVIIVLIKLVSKFVQGRGGRPLGHGSRSAAVSVVGRQSLGKGVQVAMVAAGRQTFLLGVTQHQVTLLGEVETDETAAATDHDGAAGGLQLLQGENRPVLSGAGLSTGWKTAIEQMRLRTVRRA